VRLFGDPEPPCEPRLKQLNDRFGRLLAKLLIVLAKDRSRSVELYNIATLAVVYNRSLQQRLSAAILGNRQASPISAPPSAGDDALKPCDLQPLPETPERSKEFVDVDGQYAGEEGVAADVEVVLQESHAGSEGIHGENNPDSFPEMFGSSPSDNAHEFSSDADIGRAPQSPAGCLSFAQGPAVDEVQPTKKLEEFLCEETPDCEAALYEGREVQQLVDEVVLRVEDLVDQQDPSMPSETANGLEGDNFMELPPLFAGEDMEPQNQNMSLSALPDLCAATRPPVEADDGAPFEVRVSRGLEECFSVRIPSGKVASDALYTFLTSLVDRAEF